MRAPDVAFVSRSRIRDHIDEAGYLPLAPDLVAEVVSPNDAFGQVEQKAFAWLDAGVCVVLVVDPSTRTVREYRDRHGIRVLHQQDELELQDIVPGWTLSVAQLFV